MIVSAVQFGTMGVEDIRGRAFELVRAALEKGPDYILLHELFTTPYFPQYRDSVYFELAEELPGETTDRLARILEKTGTTVVAPLFEKCGDKRYLSAAVVNEKGLVGVYRKVHLPTLEAIHEPFYFAPGAGHPVFHAGGAAFGVLLCYDRHFPESARLYGLGGAELLFVSAATPKGARSMWFAEMRSLAMANACFLVCANRTGKEDAIPFLGSSFICDYQGEILARAGEDGDEIITAVIDVEGSREKRRNHHFYRDRRPDLYGPIVG